MKKREEEEEKGERERKEEGEERGKESVRGRRRGLGIVGRGGEVGRSEENTLRGKPRRKLMRENARGGTSRKERGEKETREVASLAAPSGFARARA
ncbi:hypothetical protein NX905_29325, partial [Burkholderia thailandensis]|uniref:hypothetical protein n=1 Tax=Burkholderia thailandensis TaxID=57975 RepID=UPI00217E80FC